MFGFVTASVGFQIHPLLQVAVDSIVCILYYHLILCEKKKVSFGYCTVIQPPEASALATASGF